MSATPHISQLRAMLKGPFHPKPRGVSGEPGGRVKEGEKDMEVVRRVGPRTRRGEDGVPGWAKNRRAQEAR